MATREQNCRFGVEEQDENPCGECRRCCNKADEDVATLEAENLGLRARVRELESKLSRAVGECAKSKDDLRRLEVETEWREGVLVVHGRELHIRMRGDMFVFGIDPASDQDGDDQP